MDINEGFNFFGSVNYKFKIEANYFLEFDQFTKDEYEQLIEFVCTT